ncbi:MAG: choice-of-anchor D domain-containing protein [Alphaproteobacteria bacterium]|nr:choice-of-anchor D domain-containing protein [Alphaproteobacteria bacterium]
MLLLALLACKGGETPDTQDPAESGPLIRLSPASVDFGEVPALGAATEVITVENLGELDLHLLSLELDDPTQPFVIGAPDSAWVAPGQTSRFLVSFAPETQGPASVNVILSSDAADSPELGLQLRGTGVAPERMLLVEPANLTLPEVLVGCPETQRLSLRNVGSEVLQLDAITALSDTEFWSVDLRGAANGPLPWSLGAGQAVEIAVGYAPLEEGVHTQTLRFTAGELEVNDLQTGIAVTLGTNTDVFEVGQADAVDVVIALNTQSSMDEEMANVVLNLESLVAAIDDWRADTNLAVVTADDGCVAGATPFLRNIRSDDERLDALAEMLAGERDGRFADAPFTLLEAALSEENLGEGGCNEGLLREEASLALLSISDQAEGSANPYSYYVSLFQSMKSRRNLVKMSALAGDYPNGCATADGGRGLYEASVATGGFFLSICQEDLRAQLYRLESVGDYSDGVFPLSDTPVPSTIVVTYQGQQLEQGWIYVAEDNQVLFDEAPVNGSTVVIDYALQPDCPE